jgi:signal transduction histidine kinase
MTIVSVLLASAIATTILAVQLEIPSKDALSLATLAGGSSAAVGVLGAVVLQRTRYRGIAFQLVVVTLTAVTAIGTGAAIAARQMFISTHDLSALLVVLAAALGIAIATAMWLARNVMTDVRSLERIAVEAGDLEVNERMLPKTREFATVARRLDETLRELTEANERERALDRSRRELVAWVSHDLRTPLAGIRALAEALEDGIVADRETIARYHRTIRTEVDRLSDLVDDLFELSRINSGTLRLQLEKVSLNELVSDAVAGAAGLARAKGVHLEGRMEPSGTEVELSPQEMARVFRNLLENAIRHTPSDGSVVIDAAVEDGHAFVRVVDECGGIPDDDMARVFDLAFRGEAARTKSDDSGAGLGLAIARGIVEAHQGEIAVENGPGGCSFTVRLPRS